MLAVSDPMVMRKMSLRLKLTETKEIWRNSYRYDE
jgi:hypothetical protein